MILKAHVTLKKLLQQQKITSDKISQIIWNGNFSQIYCFSASFIEKMQCWEKVLFFQQKKRVVYNLTLAKTSLEIHSGLHLSPFE